jgi:hypothetical protein
VKRRDVIAGLVFWACVAAGGVLVFFAVRLALGWRP